MLLRKTDYCSARSTEMLKQKKFSVNGETVLSCSAFQILAVATGKQIFYNHSSPIC